MRTIKFRGKDLFGTAWLYGDLVQDRDLRYIVTVNERDHFEHKMVDRETVGQFTGLLDKNGKEIYEGDILRYDEDFHKGRSLYMAVQYGEGMFYISRDKSERSMRDYSVSQLGYVTAERGEVIGNIHDNPELLKGAKE